MKDREINDENKHKKVTNEATKKYKVNTFKRMKCVKKTIRFAYPIKISNGDVTF